MWDKESIRIQQSYYIKAKLLGADGSESWLEINCIMYYIIIYIILYQTELIWATLYSIQQGIFFLSTLYRHFLLVLAEKVFANYCTTDPHLKNMIAQTWQES